MKDSLKDEQGRLWRKMGKGSFNVAYSNEQNTLVFKVPLLDDKNKNAKLDKGKRPQELWNLLNSNLKPPASSYQIEGIDGWICPFIQGRAATDKEISAKLIDIYNETGRIVIDAMGDKNFITIEKGPNQGQTVCVDVGLALLLNKSNELPKSQTSLDAWDSYKENVLNNISSFSYRHSFPKTVRTIKALLFLQEYDQTLNANFIRTKYQDKPVAYLLIEMSDLRRKKPITSEGRERLRTLKNILDGLANNFRFESKEPNYFVREYHKNRKEEERSIIAQEKKTLQEIPSMESRFKAMPPQESPYSYRESSLGHSKFSMFSQEKKPSPSKNNTLNNHHITSNGDSLGDTDEGLGANNPFRQ
ncbi:hypothetical protein [Legionella sp. WA2022007384]